MPLTNLTVLRTSISCSDHYHPKLKTSRIHAVRHKIGYNAVNFQASKNSVLLILEIDGYKLKALNCCHRCCAAESYLTVPHNIKL